MEEEEELRSGGLGSTSVLSDAVRMSCKCDTSRHTVENTFGKRGAAPAAAAAGVEPAARSTTTVSSVPKMLTSSTNLQATPNNTTSRFRSSHTNEGKQTDRRSANSVKERAIGTALDSSLASTVT